MCNADFPKLRRRCAWYLGGFQQGLNSAVLRSSHFHVKPLDTKAATKPGGVCFKVGDGASSLQASCADKAGGSSALTNVTPVTSELTCFAWAHQLSSENTKIGRCCVCYPWQFVFQMSFFLQICLHLCCIAHRTSCRWVCHRRMLSRRYCSTHGKEWSCHRPLVLLAWKNRAAKVRFKISCNWHLFWK